MASSYEVFLKTDFSEYIGKWVAITEQGVIASGLDPKEVMEHALTLSNGKKITLAKIPEEETLIY